MGNISSNGGVGGNSRRRSNPNHQHHRHPPSAQPSENRYLYTATPYPAQYGNPPIPPPQYYQYPAGYYHHPPPPPHVMHVPLPAPYDHHHQYPYGGGGHVVPQQPVQQQQVQPLVDHQQATTIKNEVNIKKETLRVVPDEEDPGRFLVAFTFDATTAGRITLLFFAKEKNCKLTPTKEDLFQALTVSFEEGLCQTFQQPSGTGIDFSMFDEAELAKRGELNVYPLVVKAQATPGDKKETEKAEESSPVDKDGMLNAEASPTNNKEPVDDDDHHHHHNEESKKRDPDCQVTQAVFKKHEGGEYKVQVVSQTLRVDGIRYELQEIFGIGNLAESGDFDGNDSGKECVICLSEPRDTAVIPCRHMCLCSGCAQVLSYQVNRCPICRQPILSLLKIDINANNNQQQLKLQGGEELQEATPP